MDGEPMTYVRQSKTNQDSTALFNLATVVGIPIEGNKGETIIKGAIAGKFDVTADESGDPPANAVPGLETTPRASKTTTDTAPHCAEVHRGTPYRRSRSKLPRPTRIPSYRSDTVSVPVPVSVPARRSDIPDGARPSAEGRGRATAVHVVEADNELGTTADTISPVPEISRLKTEGSQYLIADSNVHEFILEMMEPSRGVTVETVETKTEKSKSTHPKPERVFVDTRGRLMEEKKLRKVSG